MIYFDNSATSPVDPEVLEAMLPYLKEEYGNPSSKYYLQAVHAQQAVEEAREKVAALLGKHPEEIVFTAGATESTNFIIKGFLDYQRYYGNGKTRVVTSKAEHKATLNVCRFLNGEIYSNQDATMSFFGENPRVDRGFQAAFVDVHEDGSLDLEEFQNAVDDSTALASVIFVNNESGAINNIQEISRICREKGAALHLDITQALGKLPVHKMNLDCDFMSLSAHKIYGPKGVGAAYLKEDDYGIPPISALLHGGEQEKGLRAGTLCVHNIVGFGKAAQIALRDFEENSRRIQEADEYFVSKIREIPEISLTNPSPDRCPGIISLRVDKKDFHNERFIKAVSQEIAISTGSACSAGEPSHVIQAMGLGEYVNKILRISIGKNTTKENIDELVRILKENI